MKNNYFLLLLATTFLVSCENNSEDVLNTEDFSSVQEIDMSDFYAYTETTESTLASKGNSNSQKCYTMNELNRQLDANPGLYQKMYNIEKHTRQFIAGKGKPPGAGNGNGGGNGGGGDGGDGEVIPSEFANIEILVNVNIIETSLNNVTDAQVSTQMDVLNSDYSDSNPNRGNVPEAFAPYRTDPNITFKLNTVTRRTTSQTNWPADNSMKYTSQGGLDAVNPETHLNIWVVNAMNTNNGSILGYAQFPGGATVTDGIVLGKDFFGVTGNGPYGGGRTAIHEVGHWLNLRHIWGDGRCNRDDFVSDTPKSDRYNTGCPTFPLTHCKSADMTMNYMDYTYDTCMYMFTHGQNDRMHAVLTSGGSRGAYAN